MNHILIQSEIAKAGGYDIVFISPDAYSWNPNCETWGDQEDFPQLAVRLPIAIAI